MNPLIRFTITLALILMVGAAAIKWRYGGGEDFPDRSTPPEMTFEQIEKVADLPSPPGNIAVSATGRVFFSFHPEARPATKLAEWRDGQFQPWPNEGFQTGQDQPRHFRDLLGIRIDQQNRLWTLDNGHHGFQAVRLLAFDLDSGNVVHEYVFSDELAGLGSHLNDLQISRDGRTVYIADASIFAQTPALIVYDVGLKKARRLLEGHASVTPEAYTPVVQGRRMELFGIFSIRPGIDSIGLDRQGEWLYFAPVSGTRLYRVRTEDLRNTELAADALAAQVEVYADKTMSDGISTDVAGNIYLTDPEHSAIHLLTPERKLRTLLRDDRLRWPDGLSFGPDGWLYITCSSLQTVLGRLPTAVTEHAPYQIYRFRAPAPAAPGQ